MGERERVNRLRVKDEPSKLPFFPARILSKDGVVVGEHVPVWIHVFREGHQERWDGSFEVPAIQFLPYDSTYTLRFADGRQGTIIHIMPIIRGENLTVYFEGSGPLAQKHEGDGEACRRP
jgi:hypothetical protein